MASKTVSKRGLMEIVQHEAIVLTRYKDSVGVWTIGVGHTRQAGPPDPKTITKSMEIKDVLALFKKDLKRFEKDVNAAVEVTLAQHEFDALVSFHFNTGGIEKAALTESINEGDKAKAAEQFMNWSKPPEIIGRRKKEQTLFATGTYSNSGMATVYPADAAGKVNFGKGKSVDIEDLL
jgi:lysozyme